MRVAIVPVTPFAQNCSIAWDEATGRGAVVDPGGDLERVLATAKQHGVVLEKILLTHAHVDHEFSKNGTVKSPLLTLFHINVIF